MKILIGAYACEPFTGSEPGVGWHWALEAARQGHDVYVITRSNNRRAIQEALLTAELPNLQFYFFDLPAPVARLKKKLGHFGLLAYYYLWQFGAATVAARLHRKIKFDLAHHVTFVNDWMPSGLAVLKLPFVWGPVGGSTHVIPRELLKPLPRSAKRYEFIRIAMQRFLHSIDPLVKLTRSRASSILTYTEEALEGIPSRHRSKARPVIHIGVSEEDLPSGSSDLSFPPETDPLRILTGGRLVHWKGFDMLLEGFGNFLDAAGQDAHQLIVTGEGSFKPFMENIVRSRQLSKGVTFVGRLPHRDEVYELMESCQIYALPTMRDGPPVAILEAMFAGRAILCLDMGATREMVPSTAGFKVDPRSRAEIIDGITASLVWANSHRTELRRMGAAARSYASIAHDWRRIGQQIARTYETVMSAS